ncbi:hypothetical protein [Polyangium spumosum]|uniref:STAS/SEC14 domain-containing protein n=1 Tax=Polyangium spumosum TaxID=889282 RepID=A0A6N7QAV1_9BACT|nr:hypothetical protein [Polyangium spumosum]MRG97991.1 hypothetical protein [Polyangium spumosum]
MRDALSLITIEATKDHVVAVFHRVILLVFERETTLSAVAACRKAFELLEKKYPDGVSCLTIVAENAPLPSQEVSDAITALAMGATGKRIRRSAVCFEGGGFRGALVRGVATGLQLVAKLPFPHRVFHSVDLAAAWLAPELGAQQIVSAVDLARGKVVTMAKAR